MKPRKPKLPKLKVDDLVGRAAAENIALGRARDAALEAARCFDLAMQEPYDGKRRALVRAGESAGAECRKISEERIYFVGKTGWTISAHEQDHDERVWFGLSDSKGYLDAERECDARENELDEWATKHLATSKFRIVHVPPAGRELDDVYRQVLASTEGITAAVKDVGADAEVAACQAEHTNRELAKLNERIDELTGEEFRKAVAAEVLTALDKALDEIAERKTA